MRKKKRDDRKSDQGGLADGAKFYFGAHGKEFTNEVKKTHFSIIS